MWRAEEKTRLAFGLRLACSQLLAINCKSVGEGIPYTVYGIRHTAYGIPTGMTDKRRPTWAHAQRRPKTLENRSSHINSFRGHSPTPLFPSLSLSLCFVYSRILQFSIAFRTLYISVSVSVSVSGDLLFIKHFDTKFCVSRFVKHSELCSHIAL